MTRTIKIDEHRARSHARKLLEQEYAHSLPKFAKVDAFTSISHYDTPLSRCKLVTMTVVIHITKSKRRVKDSDLDQTPIKFPKFKNLTK